MRRFSKGMLQRVGIAQALVNDPELLILDEPMSGLDPVGRRLVRNLILEQKAAGKTLLFSTHILPDAETLCDRVAVLRGGRLLDVGPLSQILKLDVSHMEVLAARPAGPGRALATRGGGALAGRHRARGGGGRGAHPLRSTHSPVPGGLLLQGAGR
jgi:ABC-2 type transport system ATP-binding protein